MNIILKILPLITLGVLMGNQMGNGSPPNPALLVIDVQKAYIDWMDQSEVETATTYINGCIDLFRRADLPVIRVYNEDIKNGPSKGSKEFEFIDEIDVISSDPMVIKSFSNSFKNTDLDSLLKSLNVNTLFLCGLSATGCVIATYYGGLDKDYQSYLVEKALMSPDRAHTKTVQEFASHVNYSGIDLLLKSLKN